MPLSEASSVRNDKRCYVIFAMIERQEYPKSVADAFMDAEKALAAIGVVKDSNLERYTLRGKTRYGLQGIKISIDVTPVNAGSAIRAIAKSDDIWDAGGKSAVKRFFEALGRADDPTYVPRKNALTPLQTTSRVIGFVAILLGVMALIHWEPGLEIEGATGKIRKEYAYNWSIDDAGRDLALSVWNAASKHRKINRIVVSVYLSSALLNDKYGNRLKDDVLMGHIPVNDLQEVRRYASEGAYSVSMAPIYAALVRKMDYSSYFER